MKRSLPFIVSLGACIALTGGLASGQASEELACEKTRAEVKAECVQFLKTHRWNEGLGTYVLREGTRPPEGVRTREEVIAERDAFLSTHRYNNAKSMWEPIPGKARVVSTTEGCTRAEIAADCAAFMKTHKWNEGMSKYVEIKK